ncbi:SDR family oxidoreductase [Sphingobium sp.]|uniref:SDR family NAD(P)-dependent oxidoreductase n=1 Tax=Sphingobium sp. TaxID=1912891 RepID=UPI0028BD8944|nr:SDR family oxidoreductase [Sphingobium sp.]
MAMPPLKDHLQLARLDGRAYVVLGAGGGGLGDASCEALAGAGAQLLCVDRSEEQARAIAAHVGGEPFVADITRRADVQAVFDHARAVMGDRFSGVIDVVGMAKNARIDEMDDDAIEQQFAIVLRHALLTVQIAGPMLASSGGGTLTFVGSLSGMAAIPNQTFYGIAKAALHHLVRYAAQELGPDGVRVNGVAPGFISTPRLVSLLPAEMWERLAATNPLRRVATPDDIAKAILFLVSDLAQYVNGNILTLDGGVSQTLSLGGTDALRDAQR